MNLVIDIGNSLTKVAIFDAGEIVQTFCVEELIIKRLSDLKRIYPGLNKAILSSVANINTELLKELKEKYDFFIQFNHQTAVPIENLYESKETLGLDRLAAAIGGVSLFPGKELLVIDAGTAITFDLIDKNNRFLGGNISPGLKTRFRALHKFTRKLPEIECADQWPDIGKTTEEAIRAGVQNGMIFEIDGMIDHVRKNWPECQVILTGGDLFFFDKKLKNTIFVKFEITLIGLNRILEYNAEKN
ncbi:MAG: type III pantothenate kinase [Bacteroidia bacterium]|nr:type III pantothenate kinase [Bacteroidia bacterium]